MSAKEGPDSQFLEMTAGLVGYEADEIARLPAAKAELAYRRLASLALERYAEDIADNPADSLTPAFRLNMLDGLRTGRPLTGFLRRLGYIVRPADTRYLLDDLADWLLKPQSKPLATNEDMPWYEQMACAVEDPVDFNPSTGGMTPEADVVCNEVCTVRERCLAYALANGIDEGIWGGRSERERRHLQPGGLRGNFVEIGLDEESIYEAWNNPRVRSVTRVLAAAPAHARPLHEDIVAA